MDGGLDKEIEPIGEFQCGSITAGKGPYTRGVETSLLKIGGGGSSGDMG